MNIIKTILLWSITVFFALLAIASLPGIAGWVGLLTVVLLLPIDKWQTWIRKFIKGKLKIIIAVILACVTLCTLPNVETSEQVNGNLYDEVSSVSTTTTIKGTTTTQKNEITTTTKTTTATQKNETTTTIKTTTTTITKTVTNTTAVKPTTTTTKKITTTTTSKKTTTTTAKTKYVLNTESKKFHYITCKKLPTKNREDTYMSREEIISLGYSPCGICKP